MEVIRSARREITGKKKERYRLSNKVDKRRRRWKEVMREKRWKGTLKDDEGKLATK